MNDRPTLVYMCIHICITKRAIKLSNGSPSRFHRLSANSDQSGDAWHDPREIRHANVPRVLRLACPSVFTSPTSRSMTIKGCQTMRSHAVRSVSISSVRVLHLRAKTA